MFDFGAAFDKVDPKFLLNKFNFCGFEASAAAWIKIYLINKKYMVHLMVGIM